VGLEKTQHTGWEVKRSNQAGDERSRFVKEQAVN